MGVDGAFADEESDGDGDVTGFDIARRRERHPGDPVSIIGFEGVGERKREAGFTDATGAGEGDEADIIAADERGGGCKLALVPDSGVSGVGGVASQRRGGSEMIDAPPERS